MKRKLMLVLLPLAAMAVTGCGKIDRGGKNPDEPGQCESVSVTLNKTSLSLALGGTETLVATVNPADCPVIWTTSNPAVASVSQSGKVTGVSEGTATITVGNASCAVSVSKNPITPDPDKEIVSLGKVTVPASVEKDGALLLTDVTVVVNYSDGTSDSVNPERIDLDTSVVGDAIQGTVYVGELSAPFTIKVTGEGPGPGPVDTEEITLNITNIGKANNWQVGNDSPTHTSFEDQGIGVEISATGVGDYAANSGRVFEYEGDYNIRLYSNENVSCTLTSETKILSAAIEYKSDSKKGGALVVGETQYESNDEIENNSNTFTFGVVDTTVDSSDTKAGNIQITKIKLTVESGGVTPTPPDPDKEIDHIAIEGTPSKLSYAVGESYSANGLHIEAYYDDETHATISGTIAPSKATAEEGDTTISFNATVDGHVAPTVTFNVTITEASEEKTATASYGGGSTTNMDGTNQAELLGVKESAISIVGTKENGGQNNVGLNTAGQIRLYKNNTCALTISIDGGTIVSLDVELGGTIGGLTLNDTALTISANSTVNAAVGGNTAVLKNPHNSTQTYIISIVIHYTLG